MSDFGDFARLRPLGWTDADTAAALPVLQSVQAEGLELYLGRIVRHHRDSIDLCIAIGQEKRAVVPGRLFRLFEAAGEQVGVGDWVIASVQPGGLDRIEALVPRRTAIFRKAAGEETRRQLVAANIDTALIASALPDDVNLRRIERYVAAVGDGGAQPVIVLTKRDLCPDPAAVVAEIRAVLPQVPVLCLSTKTGEGVAELDAYLAPGASLAVIGSSGVGKSTLINQLIGRTVLATGAVDDIGKGRHTTTRRELLFLPSGAVVIDTPGMRELALWGVEEEGLADSFADLAELAADCRFRDCRHGAEPGCAVQAAIADGRLAASRLAAYHKLQAEQAARLESRPAAVKARGPLGKPSAIRSRRRQPVDEEDEA